VIKGIAGTVLLGLVGLFGYYYLTDSSGKSGQERAKDAGLHVLDTAKNTAAGGAIQAALTTALGMDATRLLHVWYDDGRVVVYGLAPAGTDEKRIRTLLSEVSGIKSVEILIQERPDYVSVATGAGNPPPELRKP
jgi:hypothetical protein